MTHWYGWLAFAIVAMIAGDHLMTLVSAAWRGPRSSNGSRYAPSVLLFAAWTTFAVALVAA